MVAPKTICLYGATGLGKTSNIGEFSRYVYETTGKVTRLISSDGGGWDPVQPYIDVGVIEAFRLRGDVHPRAVLRKLSRGEWPVVTSAGTLQFQTPTPETWKKVGGYAIEGLTSSGDLLMQELRQKGPKLAQDPSYVISDTIEGNSVPEQVHGGNPSYFGFVQNELHDVIYGFANLPVVRVIWTALDGKGEEEMTRATSYGPQIIGRKATGKAPQWLGTCLHMDSMASAPAKGAIASIETRLYFIPHPDPVTGVMYPAKTRLPPEMVPGLMGKWPGGYLLPKPGSQGLTEALADFLRVEDELMARSLAGKTAWKAGIDGGQKMAT